MSENTSLKNAWQRQHFQQGRRSTSTDEHVHIHVFFHLQEQFRVDGSPVNLNFNWKQTGQSVSSCKFKFRGMVFGGGAWL